MLWKSILNIRLKISLRYNIFKEMLRDRYRSLELIIKNDTSKELEFGNVYFNSGGWYDSHYFPTTIQRGKDWSQAVANEAGSMTGVTGGLQLNVGKWNMGLGFTNPVLGCYKSSVCLGTAQKAYEQCTDASQKKKIRFGDFTLTVHQENSSIGAMAALVYYLQEDQDAFFGGGSGGKVWIQDNSGFSNYGNLGKNQIQKRPDLNKKYRINNK